MSDFARSAAGIAFSHTCDDDEEESAGLRRSSSAGGDPPSGGGGSLSVSVRKPRGRPPGSKNKPKPPVVITRDSESSMHPVVLELAAGSDILESVASFARRRRVGVSILGGSGAVSSVALRQPATSAASFTISGRFDILSLSGTFLPSAGNGGALEPAAAFTISLAGARGDVIGGVVAGAVTAAGPVVVVGASFLAAEFQRLPMAAGEEEGDGEDQQVEEKAMQPQPPPVASSVALECFGKQLSAGQMPHDMVMWAVPASSRSLCTPHLRPPPSHY